MIDLVMGEIILVKFRNVQVRNKSFYVAIGVTTAGE